MTDQQEPLDDPSRTTAKPFILAVSIVAILMIGIIVSALLRPAEESRSDADRINASVSDFVRASNNDDADAIDHMVCQGFAEERSPIAGREGEIKIEEVTNAAVNGTAATADVRIDAGDGKGAATSTWQFVHGDGIWLVCN
ncbi:hypothetical protein [Rhodococcus sp. AG1013]|uniref:Rv0361 family membrane protein n=1 Tax=unclassified Rhodococcus (in: high G+C Gram-positive bacteria) TaxID=192944 RepID=UPI000E0ACE9A|nr:hypothetical protein [Rhodococcus sp. AG1013]RDI26936.1 hypothetical protein DEU38_108171 [Rhodococcus sp. AG1013]